MQLYGHYHREHFSTTKAVYSRKPIATNLWASSVAVFEQKNPSFRILQVDKKTLLPVDWEVHYYDIDEPENGWNKHYSYKEMFELEDISPVSMLELAEEMAVDYSLA